VLSQSAHDSVLSQSDEISVEFNGISSIDIDLTYVFFGKGYSIDPWLRVVRWRNWPLFWLPEHPKQSTYAQN